MRHPKALWILASADICERFAFWGIADLLVLYVVQYYRFSNEEATILYGIFAGCSAFMPLIGGILADRWKVRSALFLGAALNAAGCFLLAAGAISLLYIGLVVLAFSIGLFTPSILTLLGQSYRDHPHLRDAGFSIYYASINIGVLLALLTLGYLAQYATWKSVFLAAGMVQLVGLVPILYIKENDHRLQTVQKSEKKPLAVIFILSGFACVFWIAYNQAWSSMPLFIKNYTDRNIHGWTLPIGWILSFESLCLILLAPFFAWLYPFLQKRHRDPLPPRKMAMGLAFSGLSFIVMAIASYNAKSALIYPILFYCLMAVGEMLLAPIGLSQITKLTPRHLTARMVGLWYVFAGFASFIGGSLAGLMNHVGGLSHFFAIFIFLTLIPALLLAYLARNHRFNQ